MADTDQAAKAAVVVVDAGAKQPPASQPGPLQEEQEVGPGQQAAVMAPPPSPGEDAKVRSLAASVDGVVEAEVDKGQGNGKGASDGGAAAAGLASPEAAPRGEGSTGASAGEQQPPQPQPAPSTPAGAGQDGGGGSPAPQLRTPGIYF